MKIRSKRAIALFALVRLNIQLNSSGITLFRISYVVNEYNNFKQLKATERLLKVYGRLVKPTRYIPKLFHLLKDFQFLRKIGEIHPLSCPSVTQIIASVRAEERSRLQIWDFIHPAVLMLANMNVRPISMMEKGKHFLRLGEYGATVWAQCCFWLTDHLNLLERVH